MADASLVRLIYGLSISLHNVFAGIPMGMALLYAVFSFQAWRRPSVDRQRVLKLCFDLLVLTILLATATGFLYELEFKRFWPVFDHALSNWHEHPAHFSAILSFFLSSGLLLITYHFKWWKNPALNLLLSGIWLLLAWMFSGWGIFLNTIMQAPGNAEMIEGVMVLNDPLNSYFFSTYHLARQVHIAGASMLKATALLGVLLLWLHKDSRIAFQRTLITCLLAGLVVMMVSGHLQMTSISHLQPTKFAAMEGLFSAEDTSAWRPVAYMTAAGEVKSLPIAGGLQRLTDAPLTTLDSVDPADQPPVRRVFHAFRIMLLGFLSMGILLLVLAVNRNTYKNRVWWIVLLSAEIAINFGWILSESGRQPWFLYELMRRQATGQLPGLNWSLAGLAINSILLLVITLYGLRIVRNNTLAENRALNNDRTA